MVDEPAAGDIMIAGHGKHVGLVVGAKSAKNVVPSIEGNTWSHGTADNHKDGVYAKSHTWLCRSRSGLSSNATAPDSGSPLVRELREKAVSM